jgi:cytochrome c oxidase subunit 2
MAPMRRLGPTVVFVLLPALAWAGAPGGNPASLFQPASGPAEVIRAYAGLVLGICAGIFATVATLLVVTVVRFRRRAGSDDREPPQVYGSNPLELAWTVVPLIIVFILGLVTVRTIAALQIEDRPPGWMQVTVIGHQWWWEFAYPELGFVTANELHVPEGRPVFLRLESDDVVHSFWIPRLSGKTDVVPNRENAMWIHPLEPGLYVGQCAEYCGTQHAHMLIRVFVDSESNFERWVANQQQPAVEDPAASEGRDLFLGTACINCHTVRGTVANGRFAPDLTHLMSRTTLGAGVAENDRENLLAWLKDPDHLKPGVRMPAMGLAEGQWEQLVVYLTTLR